MGCILIEHSHPSMCATNKPLRPHISAPMTPLYTFIPQLALYMYALTTSDICDHRRLYQYRAYLQNKALASQQRFFSQPIAWQVRSPSAKESWRVPPDQETRPAKINAKKILSGWLYLGGVAQHYVVKDTYSTCGFELRYECY